MVDTPDSKPGARIGREGSTPSSSTMTENEKPIRFVFNEDETRAGAECRCGWHSPLRPMKGRFVSLVVIFEIKDHLQTCGVEQSGSSQGP